MGVPIAQASFTGNVSSVGDATITNGGIFTGGISTSGNTTITNTGTINGNIALGAGNDTITTTGAINGSIAMGAGTNTIGFGSTAALPSGALSADAAGLNTINLFGDSPQSDSLTIAVTNFDVLNKNGTGTWDIAQSISLADKINVNAGVLTTGDADFLGANTIVNNAAVTFTGTANGTYSGAMSGTGAVNVSTGAGVTTFSGANTYSGGTNISSGTLSVTGGAALLDTGTVTLSGTGTLDVAATETIGVLNGTVGSVTLSGGNLLVNSGAFGGVISGTNGIEKIGTGTLTLSGANTFTGAATVTNGTLALSGGAAIADGTAVVVNANSTAGTSGVLSVGTAETIGSLAGNGGSVVLTAGLTTGGNNTSTSYAGVISGAGSLTKAGTGTFTLTGANTYSGGTTVNGGTLEGNTVSVQGNVLVNAGATLLFTQPTNGTYAGNLTGVGTVTKAGAGVLTLSGTNSGHSGTTNLNGGTVAIAAAGNIGTGTLAFDSGVLETTAAVTLANNATLGAGGGTVQADAATTLSGVISGAGALTKTGAGNLTLSGANTYSGGTTVSAGTLTGTTVSLQGNIVNNAAVVFDDVAGGIYAGNLSGTGTLTKLGVGTVTLNGTNTYTGATTISAGTVVAGGTGIGDLSALNIDTNGTLILGADEEVGSLSGAGALDTGGFLLTAGGNGGSTTFSGTAAGTGIVKVGAGALTLSGTGTLTDGIGVAGGSVVLSGVYSAPAFVGTGATLNVTSTGDLTGAVAGDAGSFTVINGVVTGDVGTLGRLSGAGTVNGDVTIGTGGTLAPGNSPGIFTVNGNYTQTTGSTLAAEVTPSAVAGTGYDQVHVTGTATLAGTLAVTPSTGLYVAGSTYDVVRSDNGITGSYTVTGNVISPFLTLANTGIVTTTGTEQVYRLTVARTSYATGLGSGATPNQIATANGFQGLVTGATGDAAVLVTAVDNMTAGQAQSFFDQASPESYGAYATAIQDQGELFTRQVALRLHGSNTGAGTGVWGRAYGQWGNGDNSSYRFGSDQDITGGALGVDFGSDNGLTLGLAVGWSKANIDYDLAGTDGDSKGWQVGGYAGYTSGNISADLQIAYVDGNFDAKRTIAAGTVSRVADANFDGNLWKVVGTVGYNAETGGMTLRPFVGIDYSNGKVKSFTETGAGAANLTVASIDADDTDLLVGLDVGSKATGKISPYGRLVYRYNLDNNDRNITAAFNGNAATAFTVNGVEPGKSQFDVDAGLSFALSPTSSIFAGYQGTFRKDLNRHGVSGGVRFGF